MWQAVVVSRSSEYEFKEDPAAAEVIQSAVCLIKLVLRGGAELLPEHRRMVIDSALWKITEAESRNKHRTRFCSQTVFSLPDCECRHDHVFQKGRMIDELIEGGEDSVEEIVAKAVACTISKEEHLALNRFKHLYGWERYRQAGIVVIDARTGTIFNRSGS